MSRMLIKAVVATLIQVVLIFNQRSVEAEISDTCDNSTYSLTCIHTYEQLYGSLTKSENSFKIESALYPAKRPSSVRVFVSLHGPNKTDEPFAQYTWSLSCLYVALPTIFLEIVSLGSILVSHRTKELNLTIPNFCCNVSKTEDERRKTTKDMIEGVLASLQDLAISPGIRDPRLNNAECVIEGHGIDMEATRRSLYIRIMMWGSFFFSFVAYEPFCQMTIGYATLLKITKSSGYEAMVCLSIFVGILGSVTWMVVSSFITYYIVRDGPSFYVDTCIFLLLILVLCFITTLPYAGKYIWVNCRSSNPGPRYKSYMWYIKLFAPLSAIYTCLYFCWVLIGIMLNPIWGLTVALVICFTIASFTYVVYSYVNLRQSLCNVNMQGYLRKKWMRSWLAVIFLTLVVVFAGQSFNERETADEILRTVLLAAFAYVISWLSWRSSSKNKQTQPALGDPFTDHSPNQSPSANDTVNQLLQLVALYSGQQPHSAIDPGMPIIDETTAEVQSSSEGSSHHSQLSAPSETLMEIFVDMHQSPPSETSQHTPSQLPVDDSLPVNYQIPAENQSLSSVSPHHQTKPTDSSMRYDDTVEPRELQPLMLETSV